MTTFIPEAMRAVAEAHVAVLLAVDVEDIGIGPNRRVTIDRVPREVDVLTFLDELYSHVNILGEHSARESRRRRPTVVVHRCALLS
jgi:hypothetical protein